MEKKIEDIIVPARQTERQRSIEETKKSRQTAQQHALGLGVSTAMSRESKKCNYCSKLNPFFRFDCVDCGCTLERKYNSPRVMRTRIDGRSSTGRPTRAIVSSSGTCCTRVQTSRPTPARSRIMYLPRRFVRSPDSSRRPTSSPHLRCTTR